jgi:hypothetical protein
VAAIWSILPLAGVRVHPLASYLRATGSDGASIVVSVHGTEYALDLDNLGAKQAETA